MKPTLTLIWLVCYISIAAVSASIIAPALPDITQALALAPGKVEWLMSSFLMGYMGGQLIYGPLANAYGRLVALKWGLHINLLGLLICVAAGFLYNFPLLIAGRVITGLGSAAGLTCAIMLINEWLPEYQRKNAIAYSSLSFTFGVGISVLLGGLVSQYITWQACFFILILQGIIMRVGVRVLDETLTVAKPIRVYTLAMNYWQAMRSMTLVVFSLIWGAATAIGYCYSAAAPQIAHEYLRISSSTYGNWNIVCILGGLFGGLSVQRLMQRFSIINIIFFGYLGYLLGWFSFFCLFYFKIHSSIWFFLSSALLIACTAYLIAGGSLIATNAIDDKANASSVANFLNMCTATVSVIIMGYLSPNPFKAFLIVLALFFLITLGLFILILSTRYGTVEPRINRPGAKDHRFDTKKASADQA